MDECARRYCGVGLLQTLGPPSRTLPRAPRASHTPPLPSRPCTKAVGASEPLAEPCILTQPCRINLASSPPVHVQAKFWPPAFYAIIIPFLAVQDGLDSLSGGILRILAAGESVSSPTSGGESRVKGIPRAAPVGPSPTVCLLRTPRKQSALIGITTTGCHRTRLSPMN